MQLEILCSKYGFIPSLIQHMEYFNLIILSMGALPMIPILQLQNKAIVSLIN
jgi:hypothetical protein